MGKKHSGEEYRYWEPSDPPGLTEKIFSRFEGEDRGQFRRVVRYQAPRLARLHLPKRPVPRGVCPNRRERMDPHVQGVLVVQPEPEVALVPVRVLGVPHQLLAEVCAIGQNCAPLPCEA